MFPCRVCCSLVLVSSISGAGVSTCFSHVSDIFEKPSSVMSLNCGLVRLVWGVVTPLCRRCIDTLRISADASRVVCVVFHGVSSNSCSAFLAASMRNKVQSDTSSMWRSVALAPLARNACFRTLIFQRNSNTNSVAFQSSKATYITYIHHVHVCTCIYNMYTYIYISTYRL